MIHKFVIDNNYMVVDVNSGAVHVVDGITWDVLDLFNKLSAEEIIEVLTDRYSKEEAIEVLTEISELVKEGLLFSEDKQQNEFVLPEKPIVKSLCLHVAHDCNLRCTYCFASTGHFGGQRTLMSAETGKQAIDFLIEQSGPRKHCEIDFFGGEPLLNWNVVKELVSYGKKQAAFRDKLIKFTLTTNGVLLKDDIIEFLNKENISVVLSLDGRPEINDRMRPFPNGKGCYEFILPKFKTFAESRDNENYYIRGTYTRYNLDFAADVEHLANLGFKHISVEPVVAPPTEVYAFRNDDIPVLKAQYETLANKYIERETNGTPYNFFHFNLDLEGGPCLPKRLSGCGAGHEYLAVDPEGNLYPCHQFVGREEFKLGDVKVGLTAPGIMKQFQAAHIYNKEKCLTCWAKFYCSGGCHANAEAANGTLLEPYEIGCELAKKRLECAIYVKAKQQSIL